MPFNNSVTIIDGASNTTLAVSVGQEPVAVAVNPVTNTIYVANELGGNVTVIDGTTNGTAMVPAGTFPASIAVNPVTNKIYVANSTTAGTVTVIDGANGTTTTVAVGKNPQAIAVDPVLNQIYVANYLDSSVTMIDGMTNVPSTIAVGTGPIGVAANPATGKAYVANFASGTVTEIDGATHATRTLTCSDFPFAIAVNSLTNTIYVAQSDGTLAIIDGATFSVTTTLFVGGLPRSVAVNPATNKVYVVNNGTNSVSVVDGTFLTSTPVSTGNSPFSVTVNPGTGTAYIANDSSDTVTALTQQPPSPVLLTTTITPLPGNRATSDAVTFSASASSSFAPATPPVRQIFYQMDTQYRAWTSAGLGSNATFTVAGLSGGLHTLFAFATDGQDATSNDAGPNGSPLVGKIASYTFVVPMRAQVSLSGLNRTYNGSAQVVTATTNPPGLPVTITYNGSTAAPINAGNYPVVATINHPIYFGTANGTLAIARAAQTINFPTLSDTAVGAPPQVLSATASSGLPVSFSVLSGPANISGNMLTATGHGAVVIQAAQPGDGNYLPAAPVSQTIQVSGNQTISFPPLSDVFLGDSPMVLSATASSGLPVSFAVARGSAEISGNILTVTGVGPVTVLATQAGNASYTAAAPVSRTFTVKPPPLTISSAPTATPTLAFTHQFVQFSALATGGGPLSYTWNFADGATANGTVVSHAYAAAGVYTVTLQVSDIYLQKVSATTVVTVTALDPNGDENGDSYTNDVAVALGSDPFAVGITPLVLPVITSSGSMSVTRLRINLNPTQDNADQIQITGTLSGLSSVAGGSTLVLDIGHVVRAFKLNASGKSGVVIGQDDASLDIRSNKKATVFAARLVGAYVDALTSDPDPQSNLTGNQGNSKTRSIKVTVYLNGAKYQAIVSGAYNAKKGQFAK